MKEELIKQLTLHEGKVLKVYKCPAGYLTIGVGRNLETKGLSTEECTSLRLGTTDKTKVIELLKTRGITSEESDMLLSNDIDFFTNELKKALPWFDKLPEKVKIVLVDMAFNMGIAGLLKFKKTLGLIESGKYKEASTEMLNSAWATQVGKRSQTLSNILKSV